MHLAAGNFPVAITYGGLVAYASLALSLPVACGLLIAVVRSQPDSRAGRLFAAARANSTKVALYSSYGVSVFLAIMGILAL